MVKVEIVVPLAVSVLMATTAVFLLQPVNKLVLQTTPEYGANDNRMIDTTTFAIAFTIFGIGAILSIAYESWKSEQSPRDNGRDNLWDIARFMFMTFVLGDHIMIGYGFDIWTDGKLSTGFPITSLFRATHMPGLMLISGIVAAKGEEIFSEKSFLKTLRDLVLCNAFYVIIMKMVLGAAAPLSYGLWFLVALTLNRIVIDPVFKILVRTLGRLCGSMVCIAAVTVTSWTLVQDTRLLPHAHSCLLNYAPFYAIGLALKFLDLRKILGSTAAFLGSWIFLAVWGFVVLSGKVSTAAPGTPGDFPDDTSLLTILRHMLPVRDLNEYLPGQTLEMGGLYLWQLIARTALPAVYVAAVALPLADAPGKVGQVISNVFAKCGQRTLYCYVLQMLILGAVINWGTGIALLANVTRIHILLSILALITTVAVSCSPLAEWCFGWFIQPQWLIDGPTALVSMVTAELSSKSEGELSPLKNSVV